MEHEIDNAVNVKTRRFAGAYKDAKTARDRVLRGGSWDYDARYVRAACRISLPPDFRYRDIGFRCARVQVTGR